MRRERRAGIAGFLPREPVPAMQTSHDDLPAPPTQRGRPAWPGIASTVLLARMLGPSREGRGEKREKGEESRESRERRIGLFG